VLLHSVVESPHGIEMFRVGFVIFSEIGAQLDGSPVMVVHDRIIPAE